MTGAEVLNVICVYGPQVGLSEDIKKVFLGEVGRSITGVYPDIRNSSWGEILMVILEKRPMGMIGHMEVLCLGKETVEGWRFWTLL